MNPIASNLLSAGLSCLAAGLAPMRSESIWKNSTPDRFATSSGGVGGEASEGAAVPTGDSSQKRGEGVLSGHWLKGVSVYCRKIAWTSAY